MATLYVENIPEELYEALRKRARENHSSIAAEVTRLLQQFVPTERELKARRASFRRLEKIACIPSPSPGPFPSTEDMVREDRSR